MKRKIITIDQEKCNGCGICVDACHEGAIHLVDGKATLIKDDYCDGLGDCLPVCPTDAITFEVREAAGYDDAAVKRHLKARDEAKATTESATTVSDSVASNQGAKSRLGQWPCQIKLVPPTAPYFDGADLLIAADCTAFSYANFHEEFMKDHITIVGCPKLDEGDYYDRLSNIMIPNDLHSITVARMEVPCCGGLFHAAKLAWKKSERDIPFKVITIGVEGDILSVETLTK